MKKQLLSLSLTLFCCAQTTTEAQDPNTQNKPVKEPAQDAYGSLDPLEARKILDLYVSRLKNKILTSCLPPGGRHLCNTVVSFIVLKDGSTTDISITTSSGDA